MNGMCNGQKEDHLLLPLKSLDLKNLTKSIGLSLLPREDVVYVRKMVSPEVSVIALFCDRNVLWTTTTRQIPETFQDVQTDLLT